MQYAQRAKYPSTPGSGVSEAANKPGEAIAGLGLNLE
jgi:hypothetical protein